MPAALAPSEGQLVHASTHPQWLPVIDGSWGRMGGGLLRVHLGSASPSPCLCPSVPEGHLSWRMRALLLHELRVRSCPQVLGVRTWACRPGWGAPINPHRCVSLPNFTQVGHVAGSWWPSPAPGLHSTASLHAHFLSERRPGSAAASTSVRGSWCRSGLVPESGGVTGK